MKFDYVVIGAGSAGCAVASRLSRNANYTVAILEAGPKDTNPWIHIPVGYFKTMGNPKSDWRYITEPDPGLNKRAIRWPRGKVLGGSSSINGLLFVRGQPQDYNHWRQLGNVGWAWKDVLPIFKKLENWHGNSGSENVLRGINGPLSVSPTAIRRDVVDYWIEAAVNAGYYRNPDYNGDTQEGVGYFQLTMENGRRCSSAKAYLKPAQSRKNLAIMTDTRVEKLVQHEGKVTQVVAHSKGRIIQINVDREVILSAGAIGSPHILMLSGIGSGSELSELGIRVENELPGVGKNLQDHLQARPTFKTNLSTFNTEVNSWIKQFKSGAEYTIKRTGPMTMAASLGTGFLKTHPDLETPDIQFHIQPFSANNIMEGTHPFSAFTTSVLQLRPESTGSIKLKSPDSRIYPAIYPNYLATKMDQKTIIRGIQIARKIAATDPLEKHITEEYSPGQTISMDDEEGILEWARNTAVTIYHPTGTCKMGSDLMSVVDARLRVHGVRGLRVADASIMPTITSGNTNAPSIMIGEKVSDMILEGDT